MKTLILMSTLLAGMTAAYASDPAAPPANRSVEKLTATCAACHGPTGVSPSGAFPTLAGQHASYLVKALQDYQTGERKNPIMASQVANLSAREIKALAAWYAAQEGPLYTPTLD